MLTVKINFLDSFLLKDYEVCTNECPLEKGGIYFHYIKSNNENRIIYDGECSSFKLRQEKHLTLYNKNKYTLFDIDITGELNITYIPDYDLVTEELKRMKEKNVKEIFVTCGIIESLENNTLKEVEGAIINYLYRKSETRKYFLNRTTSYTLRNTEIFFVGMDTKLYGLPSRIVTPTNQ